MCSGDRTIDIGVTCLDPGPETVRALQACLCDAERQKSAAFPFRSPPQAIHRRARTPAPAARCAAGGAARSRRAGVRRERQTCARAALRAYGLALQHVALRRRRCVRLFTRTRHRRRHRSGPRGARGRRHSGAILLPPGEPGLPCARPRATSRWDSSIAGRARKPASRRWATAFPCRSTGSMFRSRRVSLRGSCASRARSEIPAAGAWAVFPRFPASSPRSPVVTDKNKRLPQCLPLPTDPLG